MIVAVSWVLAPEGSVAQPPAEAVAAPERPDTRAAAGRGIEQAPPLAPVSPAPTPEAAPASPALGATAPPAAAIDRGMASWYGRRFHGRRTASGERYDMHALTAAHRTLPFGTRVRVRSVHSGREVVVRINDRGPFHRQRIIDLSEAAFSALGLRGRGVTQVELLPE